MRLGTKGILAIPIMLYVLENKLWSKNKWTVAHPPARHGENVKMNEIHLCSDAERSPRYIKWKCSIHYYVLCDHFSVNMEKCKYGNVSISIQNFLLKEPT